MELRNIQEEQGMKCGRIDRSSTNEDDILVGVVAHPCREQCGS